TRKALTSPYILSDEKYAMLWQAQTFQGNGFNAENKRFPSQRGDLMRSKSEVIIASILDELEIPYHYEKPLKLGDGKTRYPDFTLLDIRNRCEVYLEHLGMLDNDQYWFNACRKIK
ncbi:MAG: hypothetical protein IK059_02210, partial [Firmicutes bacterium]|nr:hypothetical protein [Bacillota bacterium]